MNEKSIKEHLEDGTFRPDRHKEKLDNYESFAPLDQLPKYAGELLNDTGKKFYRKLGRLLITEGILSPLDLPLIEQAAQYYQSIVKIQELCGGDFDRYIFDKGLSTQAAIISQYRIYQKELAIILKEFGATPKAREGIKKPDSGEDKETSNPFFQLVNNG